MDVFYANVSAYGMLKPYMYNKFDMILLRFLLYVVVYYIVA